MVGIVAMLLYQDHILMMFVTIWTSSRMDKLNLLLIGARHCIFPHQYV